jgi:hypothetical protein
MDSKTRDANASQRSYTFDPDHCNVIPPFAMIQNMYDAHAWQLQLQFNLHHIQFNQDAQRFCVVKQHPDRNFTIGIVLEQWCWTRLFNRTLEQNKTSSAPLPCSINSHGDASWLFQTLDPNRHPPIDLSTILGDSSSTEDNKTAKKTSKEQFHTHVVKHIQHLVEQFLLLYQKPPSTETSMPPMLSLLSNHILNHASRRVETDNEEDIFQILKVSFRLGWIDQELLCAIFQPAEMQQRLLELFQCPLLEKHQLELLMLTRRLMNHPVFNKNRRLNNHDTKECAAATTLDQKQHDNMDLRTNLVQELLIEGRSRLETRTMTAELAFALLQCMATLLTSAASCPCGIATTTTACAQDKIPCEFPDLSVASPMTQWALDIYWWTENPELSSQQNEFDRYQAKQQRLVLWPLVHQIIHYCMRHSHHQISHEIIPQRETQTPAI